MQTHASIMSKERKGQTFYGDSLLLRLLEVYPVEKSVMKDWQKSR